jgi:hypothetical protein
VSSRAKEPSRRRKFRRSFAAALKIEAAYLFLSHAWCVRQRLQLQGAGIEQQAGTSQAGFRFLQLGDVERRDLETCGF